jgi:hypothetical protein
MNKISIEKYFMAEKNESLIFIMIGVLAILLALAGLLYWKTAVWKGAAMPLIAIALIQLVVGYAVYSRSDAQRKEMVYNFDMNKGKLKTEEKQRMEAVNKKFIYYRWIEIALLAGGLAILLYHNTNKTFWYGFGLALFIQSGLMLVSDYFAEQRGKVYYNQLVQL